MTKTVGVILSGCGYLDGAEIQESVCTLLALDRAGVVCDQRKPDVLRVAPAPLYNNEDDIARFIEVLQGSLV